jgi:bla regulator protein BlaR1
MKTECLSGLIHASIALTIALIAVLSLRTVLRRQFSALHGYAIWVLVPLLPLACIVPLLLPKAVLPLPALRLMMSSAAAPIAEVPGVIDWAIPIIYLWVAGMIFSLALQCWRQLQFTRSLGQVERVGNIYRSEARDIGPALIGIVRPKIIVPFDFATRYTEAEQQLILAHEHIHWQRGDSLANALYTLLQCVFWFHPLINFGAVRFRVDQELACDVLVIRHHKNARKTYAQAMLKTHTMHLLLPVACTWQSNYFLKERIMQLNEQAPPSLKRHIGSGLLCALIGFSACAAWATQSTPTAGGEKKMYDIDVTTTIGSGKPNAMHVKAAAGEPFTIGEGEAGDKWEGTYVLTAMKDHVVKLESTLSHKGEVIGHPELRFAEGQDAKIEIGNRGDNTNYAVVVVARPVAVADASSGK